MRHPVPLDLNTLKVLKRSPLGLDLYVWLVYRTFKLDAPLRLSWPTLYRQFGVDPARAGEKFTVRDFRKDCLRELIKIKAAWPGLQYQIERGRRGEKTGRVGPVAVHTANPAPTARLVAQERPLWQSRKQLT